MDTVPLNRLTRFYLLYVFMFHFLSYLPTFLSVFTSVADPPTIQSANPILPGNILRVIWSQPLTGATIISYRVHYSGGDDVGDIESFTTSVDLDGLITDGRVYTISVEALSLHLSGVSESVDVVMSKFTLIYYTTWHDQSIYIVPTVPFINVPSGVVVNNAKPHSVQVSWIPQPNITRYRVDYVQVVGTDQQGLCSDVHSGSVTTADSTASAIVEGVDGNGDFRLRAFATYSITVVAVRDGVGSSGPSEARIFTTTQTGSSGYCTLVLYHYKIVSLQLLMHLLLWVRLLLRVQHLFLCSGTPSLAVKISMAI